MRIQDAWCRETSVDPDGWTSENPAWGQCAVTALVVQELLGGELRAGWVGDVRHYWVLVGSHDLDLTLRQFGSGWPRDDEPRSRGELLSNADTERRYHLLRERIGLVAT